MQGARTWELWKADQKYMRISEMWCWRKMEKIHCTDRVRNGVLHRVKEEENITHTHTHTHTKEGRSNGLVTSCVGTAFYNILLNETYRERQT